jgi:hypothetical protein
VRHARRRHRALIPQLELARQAHGSGKGLRVVDLHVVAKRWLEARDEELDALVLVQMTRAREERLEAVLVLLDGPRLLARRQLTEGV